MEFISTRGSRAVSAGEAILKGIADDGGLYVPSSFPNIEASDIEKLSGLEYHERAYFILSKFFDFPEKDLKDYCFKAYSRFGGEPAPVVKVDDETYMLELWHGPTLAFKDIALTILPYFLVDSMKASGSDKKALILVATSGDTGKAALEGFQDVEGTEIIVFYPSEGVSELQKLQMKTSEGKNVHAIGIEGNFDDAQTAVKSFFKDRDAVEKAAELGYSPTSANSINFGRLAPQIVYYFSAYADLVGAEEIKNGDKINFVVPTGNFGDILAAYYAGRMGLPVNKLLVASNSNNVLTDFFRTGKYDINRAFYRTSSPSMDILISSNLERLIFELAGRDPSKVADLTSELDRFGSYSVPLDSLKKKLPEFEAYWTNENGVFEAIDNFFDMFGYTLDPHTAVGVACYYDYVTETSDETKTVIVSTASPFKFARDVLKALTDRDEKDPFKAVKKLSAYTGEDAPEEITELADMPILHDKVIPKEKIKDTILDTLTS